MTLHEKQLVEIELKKATEQLPIQIAALKQIVAALGHNRINEIIMRFAHKYSLSREERAVIQSLAGCMSLQLLIDSLKHDLEVNAPAGEKP